MSKSVFSENLKYLRLKNNISQTQLAKSIGITRQALSKYELGDTDPNLYTLIKISNYFNCSIDSLVFGSVKLTDNSLKLDLDCFEREIETIQKTAILLESKLNSLRHSINTLKKSSSIANLKHLENNEFAEEIYPNVIDLQGYKEKVKNVKCYMTPFLGDVSAGDPCYAEEELIDIIPISKDLLCPSKEYFILNIKGDSMNKLFEPNELILVEHTHYVLNDDIAIVLVGTEEATVKKVEIDGDYITLIPMSTNPIHKPKTHHIKDVCIQGKVVGKLFDILRPSL